MSQESCTQYNVRATIRQRVDQVHRRAADAEWCDKLRNMQGMKEYTSCSISCRARRFVWAGLVLIATQDKLYVLKYTHHFLGVTNIRTWTVLAKARLLPRWWDQTAIRIE